MMNRRTLFASTMGLALAFGAAALMGAAPPDSGGQNTSPTDKHAGHDHGKDGHKHEKREKSEHGDKAKKGAKVGEKAPDFQFTDVNGQSHSLAEFAGKTVILEWMNPGCPICKGKFEDGSVAKMMTDVKAIDPDAVFIFINSTETGQGGSADASKRYLNDNKIDAIAFWEGDGAVGRLYGAQTTPHLFVVDKNGVLAYSGAIDDKQGNNYVVSAVKALKEGNTPSPATTKPYGCSVKYPKKASTATH